MSDYLVKSSTFSGLSISFSGALAESFVTKSGYNFVFYLNGFLPFYMC